MTAKFEKFEAALRALCIEHGVCLTTNSYGYIEVANMTEWSGPIWQDCIEDGTEEPESSSTTTSTTPPA